MGNKNKKTTTYEITGLIIEAAAVIVALISAIRW